jgi:hydroxypyruvate isomerase
MEEFVVMKKSICIEKIFLELPFYERFSAVKDSGFEYVEFWSWTNKDLSAIKDLLETYELKVASMSGDNDYSLIIPDHRKPFLDYLSKSIEVANEIGCKTLVIHSNAIDENGIMKDSGSELSDTVKISAAIITLLDAVKLAEKNKITLVIEAVNTFTKPGYYMCTTEQTGDLVRSIHSPRVKILYDTFHMQQMEGNIITTLRRYIDVIGYIHIGDVPERFEPGTGEINFDRFKAELKSLNYDGIVGFELTPRVSSKECVKLLKEFL